MERDYLVRRLRQERRLIWRARSTAAIRAHQRMAANYEARLALIEPDISEPGRLRSLLTSLRALARPSRRSAET
jgi:hypothetical protein